MSKEQYAWGFPFDEPELDWTETGSLDNFTAGLTFIDKLIQKLKPKTQAVYSHLKSKYSLKQRYVESEWKIYHALLQAKKGDYSKALHSCSEARKTCPENFRTWVGLFKD